METTSKHQNAKDSKVKNYYGNDPWCIVEEGFDPKMQEAAESIFSLGNGRMGQRANFEEKYTGETLQGNYVAGVYYPDKTKVGWWKNGYPEYFAKVLNATNWIGLSLSFNNLDLDLHQCEIHSFQRTLNMKEGFLQRKFTANLRNGISITADVTRINSMVDDEGGAISYKIKIEQGKGNFKVTSYLDGDIKNKDSNYEEKFWDQVSQEIIQDESYLTMATKKLNFQVCTGQFTKVLKNGEPVLNNTPSILKDKHVENIFLCDFNAGDEFEIVKFAANLSSENHPKENLIQSTKKIISILKAKGFGKIKAEQAESWNDKWLTNDIIIEGDAAAQQGIRFGIFHLNQTYTGADSRLNIGPKGFTGEKYGGSTYWDTEAYCIPFYICTANAEVAKNLLTYRYKQLDKAIENASKLGFKNGAALFPMVTMNGEECHNEWEITFEEIHRNGIIAFAIYNYVLHTDDEEYLATQGLEVLIGIARFWSQRITYSTAKNKFVLLGVTGPNEYENNINNNWYTNYIACWSMKYAGEVVELLKQSYPTEFLRIKEKTNFNTEIETARWNNIVANMHYPTLENTKVFLQQDGFMDKEQLNAADLLIEERPINQKWSWDRILRSIFIKQADVLQGIYLFMDHFDHETIKQNFDFYEPKTVHESSLSPCVHAILAAKLGYEEKAQEMYLRTARLDLDDYNNEVKEGLHITSMAGTWMAVIEGFGGKKIENGKLSLAPFIPKNWDSFSFNIVFKTATVNIKISQKKVEVKNLSNKNIEVIIYNKPYKIESNDRIEVEKI